ncbi:MAG: hypothetical protein IPK60_24940 [Sandaracinaceae bacterium]|nr:hypothetical protein [Sandaracinaceae bacterium]
MSILDLEISVEGLSEFLKAGGRVALADDFGTGTSLLRAYQITRTPPSARNILRLRDNDALLVARPSGAHPLTDGVGALVSNHPEALHHTDLAPLFSLGEGDALVLAGAVGDGRFVAIGDPSTLINNMLEFRGNRRFAENLVRYLAENGGQLFIMTGSHEVRGTFGTPGADRPLYSLRAAIERLARMPIPKEAVQVLALMLVSILLVVAATALPRRSPYDGQTMFARAPAAGGFVGRVTFFTQPDASFLQPLMVYKFELEGEILRRMNLQTQPLLRDVVDAMKSHGATSAELTAARELLLTLDALHTAQDRPPGPPTISRSRFHDLVARGEQLLAVFDRRVLS